MSTKLSNTKGVYRCANINGTKTLKFAYLGSIESGNTLKLYSIPNDLSAMPYFSMITADDFASITKTYSDNESISSSLVFQTFNKMKQRPDITSTTYFTTSSDTDYFSSQRLNTFSSFFISVIFKADLSDATSNEKLFMYENVNNILIPVDLNSNKIVHLGDNIHVLQMSNNFTIGTKTPPNNDFPFPKFAFGQYQYVDSTAVCMPISRTFTLFDIAICFYHNE